MNHTAKATLAILGGYSIFGFSFLFSKIALDRAAPFVLLSLRFLVAFGVMNLLLLTGRVRLSLKGKPVALLLLLGLVQPVLYFIFEAYGIALTSSAFSGAMIGLVPVAGLVFGAVFLRERCSLFQILCTVLSVAGVALTTSGEFGFSAGGFILLLGAVVSAALFTVLSRHTAGVFSAFERTYVMFALGSVVFTAAALVQIKGDLRSLAAVLTDPAFDGAVLYLAVVSSVCAFMLINYALNYLPAGRALIYSNFTTVISVLAGIFLLGDRFTPIQLIGIAVITLSVFGVSCPGRKNNVSMKS